MRILIVNCTPAAAESAHVRAGGRSNEAHFSESLRLHDRRFESFTIEAADEATLRGRIAIDDFDGAVLTGSPWGVYEDRQEISGQIALARRLYEGGVPVFGSCYGLQLMAKALGGDVHINPRGREVGVARAITLNEAGKAHAMFAEKPSVFDALCSHQDEVSRVPEGGVVLASNDISQVQAMTVDRGTSSFWGVQYHPEFDFATIASILERTSARNISEGLARDAAEMAEVVADMRALAERGGNRSIAWRMGLKPDVLDQRQRTAEFGAWLRQRVAPRADARAAARSLSTAAGA